MQELEPRRSTIGVETRNTLFSLFPVAAIALILGLFAIFDARIVSIGNLRNIAEQTSYLAIFAMAQLVVLVTRGFDLSLGSTVSVVSVATALAATGILSGQPAFAAIVFGLACGLGVGILNGLAIALFRINPFIATLATYNIGIGVATTISGGRPVSGFNPDFGSTLYSWSILGISAPIVFAAVTACALHVFLAHTTFGRILYWMGSNNRAAFVAGLPVRRMQVLAYSTCALLAAFGALLLTARTGSGEPNLGGALSLQSIAAAVIGGVSLAGGRGTVLNALCGALFVTILTNGMNLASISGYVQMIALGAIIVAGAAADGFGQVRRR